MPLSAGCSIGVGEGTAEWDRRTGLDDSTGFDEDDGERHVPHTPVDGGDVRHPWGGRGVLPRSAGRQNEEDCQAHPAHAEE
jgi:hypothetical protein